MPHGHTLSVPARRRLAARRWRGMPPVSRGAAWILLSCALAAAMAVLIKLLGQRYDAFEIAFFRSGFGFVTMATIALRSGPEVLRTARPGQHVLRGLIGVASMVASFWALTRLPIATATAISFTTPLFMLVLAVLLLGETVRWRRWSATAVGFGGVLVMVRPFSGSLDPAAIVSLGSALLNSLSIVLVKKLSGTERTTTILVYFSMVATACLIIPAILVWRMPGPLDILMMAGCGFCGTAAQSCTVQAYAEAEATQIAPFSYTQLVFAGGFGFLVFSEVPDGWTVVGAAIVMASTLYIARRRAALGQPPQPIAAAPDVTPPA